MKRLSLTSSGLTKEEFGTLAKLNTPIKIQDFLDALPMNWEKRGETLYSPKRVLEHKKAHCFEGALLAAAALWVHGERPLIMNLSARLDSGDQDHVVALYTRGGRFGAIGKTNHATIRFRDPVYNTLRELALSYFHEWFLNTTGEKTLECDSLPLNLSRDASWVAAEEDLWKFDEALATRKHYFLIPKGNWQHVRRADPMELAAGRLLEWPKSDSRT
jgi:hypothetical protein